MLCDYLHARITGITSLTDSATAARKPRRASTPGSNPGRPPPKDIHIKHEQVTHKRPGARWPKPASTTLDNCQPKPKWQGWPEVGFSRRFRGLAG